MESDLDRVSMQWFVPLVLLLNFSLFQYIATFYFGRRTELRVRLLIAFAAVAFLSVIPFSRVDAPTLRNMNDISESCSTLTFLMQITIVGRDITKKIKFPIVVIIIVVVELLILVDLVVVVLAAVDGIADKDTFHFTDEASNVLENIMLVAIVVCRFYFLALLKGWRKMLWEHRVELVLYLLFMTHEYPFQILQSVTGNSWEYAQALWNRVTIAMCLWITIKGKLGKISGLGGGSSNNRQTAKTVVHQTHASEAPVESRRSSLKHETPRRSSLRKPNVVIPEATAVDTILESVQQPSELPE